MARESIFQNVRLQDLTLLAVIVHSLGSADLTGPLPMDFQP